MTFYIRIPNSGWAVLSFGSRSNDLHTLNLNHLVALLPSTALQLTPRILTVAMQMVLGSHSSVKVAPSASLSSVGVTLAEVQTLCNNSSAERYY